MAADFLEYAIYGRFSNEMIDVLPFGIDYINYHCVVDLEYAKYVVTATNMKKRLLTM